MKEKYGAQAYRDTTLYLVLSKWIKSYIFGLYIVYRNTMECFYIGYDYICKNR